MKYPNETKQDPKLIWDNTSDIEPFTVPYLCPIILRKEIESVLEDEGDSSLLNSEFVEEHPILYWNLIWYFHRINLPTHLPGLYISTKIIKQYLCVSFFKKYLIN